MVDAFVSFVLGLALLGFSFRKSPQLQTGAQRRLILLRVGAALVILFAVVRLATAGAAPEATTGGTSWQRFELPSGKASASFPAQPKPISFKTWGEENVGFVLELPGEVSLRLGEAPVRPHAVRETKVAQLRLFLEEMGELQHFEDDGTFVFCRVKVGPDAGTYYIMEAQIYPGDQMRRIIAVYPEGYAGDMLPIRRFLNSGRFALSGESEGMEQP
ncbi:MAG: hypothetical protein Q7P63_02600 [Verrucomicrobiota bacterium JB022]|nr:hypothetical protein [Verrucomicrobiota bacterium JB022]